MGRIMAPETSEPRMVEEINIFEDKREPGVWTVEAFDEEGSCYPMQFRGEDAAGRAWDYALRAIAATASCSRLPIPVRIP